MSRMVKNTAALLAIVAIIFVATKFYSPQEASIRGTTNQERLEEIRNRVDKKYEYTSITQAFVDTGNRRGVAVKYVLMLNAPVSWFGASSSNPSGAQEAIGDYRNSIIDILKLTTEYVLQDMLTVENVIILVVLPDGQETQSIIPAGELISLLLGSNTVPDEAWLEKFSINSEDLTISEGLSIG